MTNKTIKSLICTIIILQIQPGKEIPVGLHQRSAFCTCWIGRIRKHSVSKQIFQQIYRTNALFHHQPMCFPSGNSAVIQRIVRMLDKGSNVVRHNQALFRVGKKDKIAEILHLRQMSTFTDTPLHFFTQELFKRLITVAECDILTACGPCQSIKILMVPSCRLAFSFGRRLSIISRIHSST